MIIPPLLDKNMSVVIYPERAKGDINLTSESIKSLLLPNKLIKIATQDSELRFQSIDGKLPSRIVTGIQLDSKKDSKILQTECSLGIAHESRPKKRFHWGIWSYRLKSKVIIHALEALYGSPCKSSILLSLYSSKKEYISKTSLNWDSISENNVNAIICVQDYFEQESIDLDEYMYVSIFSEYGGFFMYNTIEKCDSVALEHSF